MITAVDLTKAGAAKFKNWFDSVAAPSEMYGAAEEDMVHQMAERLNAAEALVYEIDGMSTKSGQTESITLELSDLDVQELIGEEGDDVATLSRKELVARCKFLLDAGRRVDAVRIFRMVTGASLQEAFRELSN